MAFDDPQLTITGNLTADPEMRFTESGTGVCTFTVAHTPRVKRGDTWTDDKDHALFMRVTAWRDLGEHVADSFVKGNRVTVRGTLRGTVWENDKGEKRHGVELTASDVAASVQYATVAVKRAARTSGGPDPVDPWSGEAASARTRPATVGTANNGQDEPPF